MQVDINFIYTDEAGATASKRAQPMRWEALDLATTPIQGDLICFGAEDDAPSFIVINRLFIWRSPEHLVIQPLLGIPPMPSEVAQTSGESPAG